jgi:UDP-glucose 4-epimerase
MNVLVTGGAGFIGSHTADALIGAGHQVTVLDNLSTGFFENVPNQAEFVELDIRSADVGNLFDNKKFDLVFHFAAQINVRTSVANPVDDVDLNIAGSIALLEICRRVGVEKFIFASTGGVIYGDQDYFPADESHPTRPISPYAIAKLSVEKFLYYYYREYGLSAIALRYGNVFGPRQNPFGEAGVAAIFSRRMLDSQPVFINGDGLQTRDYVYISDVVRANMAALQLEGFNAINIGTGRETNVLTIFEKIGSLIGTTATTKHKPAPPGEQRRSSLDCRLAQRLLSWTPEVGLDRGLELTVDYFRSHRY